MNYTCPSCGARAARVFYEVEDVPVHSVLLMPTREKAVNFPRSHIHLSFCECCGFVFNPFFNPELQRFSSSYEETQAFSSTFNAFAIDLARQLVETYQLYDKNIIEIGCGKGEFLRLLCQLGHNRGFGFDPSYVPERNNGAGEQATFIQDFYGEKYSHYPADFICCRMTFEHIQNTREFVSLIRRSLGSNHHVVVSFQIPDVRRILQEMAFWDVYYEHCSYFSAGSLARLFRRCGFEVVDLNLDYDNQYLRIEARAAERESHSDLPQEEDPAILASEIERFSQKCPELLAEWRRVIRRLHETGRKMVLWGSGSKAVAFLTTLKIQEEIEFIVDINPYRQNTYMAGTGQRIVAPDFLREYRPDVVLAMNPIYREEIAALLRRLELEADLATVNDLNPN